VKRTIHSCDVCGRKLPVLGNMNRSGDTAVYQVHRTVWQFFSRALSWRPAREEWQEMCGDCWSELTEIVRARVAEGEIQT